jgi:hypothetical protein
MSRVDDPLVKAGFNWRWVFPLDRLLVFFTGELPWVAGLWRRSKLSMDCRPLNVFFINFGFFGMGKRKSE